MAGSLTSVLAAQIPDEDVVLRALDDEMRRSMSLRLQDLDSPYFIQYTVDDTAAHRLSATYGALLSSTHRRSRVLQSQLRVGSYDLDNSNLGGRSGGARGLASNTQLPTDDDYIALRHAVWTATDSLYKGAVAVLAQKRAYLRDRNVTERAPDFSRVDSPLVELRDAAALSFDRPIWEEYVRRLSGAFEAFADLQDSSVSLTADAVTRYLVSSEGTRLRHGSTVITLRITAQAQAADGDRLSDALSYFARTPDELPDLDAAIADAQDLANRLQAAAGAPVMEDYIGPVLVDGLAASQLFRQLLARGVAAQANPLGSPPAGGSGLESRLGRRILPATFQIYDDPRVEQFQGTLLAGHYRFDDEGVSPERVEIVADGMLKGMVTSRSPTTEFPRSNGHGRRAGGVAVAGIGCLFIQAGGSADPEELKQELIDAAEAEGLSFGLRVTNLQNRAAGGRRGFGRGRRGGRRAAGGSVVGDPISIYKVYVADGREEPVRGGQFADLDLRSLRRIIAAGDAQTVHNTFGGAPSSVIAAAVLFEELELTRINRPAERTPVLPPPQARR